MPRAALPELLETYHTLPPRGRTKCLHPDWLWQRLGLPLEPE